ncbi:MAG TPA: 4-hydroxyphenylacetate 3-hydroxylase N-terminal domain-containing protein [Chloroflexota bacterium]|nr:4-hydroxyphenylacetate 3-hydroxylase N-terminal domain-containing protein [Chloroflexota bacterium]
MKDGLRTGAEYREAVRTDGRQVWVLGQGKVEDVTTHSATAPMVDEYVRWYDRHFDPEWQDVLLTPSDAATAKRMPWGFVVPKRADDLTAMARCFCATTFPTGGNVTHTPAYGQLIALGVLSMLHEQNPEPRQIASAAGYRDMIAATGRFLTFSAGAATIGYRLREDPAERAALRIVRETDRGLVLAGKIGMHTSPAYAEDVYVGSASGVDYEGKRASFIVPVAGKGVTVICRKPSSRHASSFVSPLSGRFDELDGQMWLENVLIPWEHVFLHDVSPDVVARWLFWHQLYCWLMKAEFTLGLALALTHAMGLSGNEPTVEYLVDLIVDVQTVRSCQTAAERDPQFTAQGFCYPNLNHVAAGSIAMLRARQRMSEILRILPGSSLVVAPSDSDLEFPDLGDGLEQSFGGGGYTAKQRAALLQLAWDHVSSALDARESAFELHANGGIPAWRGRIRRTFDRYNELANGVLQALDLDMPEIDLSAVRAAPTTPRRAVQPPPPAV